MLAICAVALVPIAGAVHLNELTPITNPYVSGSDVAMYVDRARARQHGWRQRLAGRQFESRLRAAAGPPTALTSHFCVGQLLILTPIIILII